MITNFVSNRKKNLTKASRPLKWYAQHPVYRVRTRNLY